MTAPSFNRPPSLLSTLADMLRDSVSNVPNNNVYRTYDSVVLEVHVPTLGMYQMSITPVLDAATGKVVFMAGMGANDDYALCKDALGAVQQCLVMVDRCRAHGYAPPTTASLPAQRASVAL
jgi:hypothetical protein